MSNSGLIKKIKELKQIRPRKNWVILTKSQILGPEFSDRGRVSVFSVLANLVYKPYKPAFATLMAVLILIGTFIFAQNTLPGDFLYPLKKVTENARFYFISEREKPRVQLELANEKLKDLVKVAQTNQTKKLAPIIEEYQANVSEAAKGLARIKEPDVKEIVEQTKKIEENKRKIAVLGVKVGETKELDNALAQIVEKEIKELEKNSLTEDQQELLEEAREDYADGNYSAALEKILLLSYPQGK